MWKIVAASVAGTGHDRAGNQDAVGFVPDDGVGELVRVAVADGHGAAMYERSARGARMAVEAALADPLGSAADASLQGMMRGALLRWEEAVDADLRANPHEMERDVYGTTLLVVSADATTVACAQLGDCQVLTVDGAGKVTSPIPDDPRLTGNLTTSLTGAYPIGNTRYARLAADGIRLLLVCTDGYENSFADQRSFFQAASDFADIIDRHGLGVVRKELRGWLVETMSGGSGDDTTVALVIKGHD
ncbi:MAG: protein phosphatase 2C domain-containing protein [Acidimicrobiia bacterium]